MVFCSRRGSLERNTHFIFPRFWCLANLDGRAVALDVHIDVFSFWLRGDGDSIWKINVFFVSVDGNSFLVNFNLIAIEVFSVNCYFRHIYFCSVSTLFPALNFYFVLCCIHIFCRMSIYFCVVMYYYCSNWVCTL